MPDQPNVEKTLDESIKDLVFSAQLMSSYDQMQKVLVKGLEALIASEKQVYKDALDEALDALGSMYEQYCGDEYGHMFMSAGEGASDVLEKYGKYRFNEIGAIVSHPHTGEE